MTNFGSKILGNSVSSLAAQQALIANISNNIANVNTPGYTRRQVELQNRAEPGAGIQIGSGVEVGDVRRLTDNFLETALRTTMSDKSAAEATSDYIGRIENLFGLKDTDITIGTSLNDFFSSVNQLSVNPSSIELRLNVLQRGEDLVGSIKTAYSTVAKVQTELDDRVKQEVSVVNTITSQIATLNASIGARESTGNVAADERDQRDVLLGKLAEKLSFTINESSNGAVNISLENGFPLVSGTVARDLSATAGPSFAGTVPPSLSGGALTFVAYNYGTTAAPSHLDLTSVIGNGSGSLSALLNLRGITSASQTSAFQADGTLVDIAARIESLTRTLLTTVNATYRGPDEDSGTANLQPSAGDLNGNAPGVFGLFDFTFSGTKDVDGDGIAELSDLTDASVGIDNFSSRLVFGVSTPEAFAAARDANPTAGVQAFASGDSSNAQALVALRTTTMSFSAGTFSFTGTFDELYNSTVAYVGNAKSTADSDLSLASSLYATAANKRDGFSAVNLDEEFSNLIRFQKAFQASAKMIRTATDLLDVIVSLL